MTEFIITNVTNARASPQLHSHPMKMNGLSEKDEGEGHRMLCQEVRIQGIK